MKGRNLSLDLFGEKSPTAVIEGELTQRQRECLKRYYFDGFSQEEIAGEMGVTPATVSRHLKKARNRLERVIGYAYPTLQKQ